MTDCVPQSGDHSDSPQDPRPADDPEIERIADEFADRCAAGEQPDVDAYLRRYPRLAEELRDILPVILQMHHCSADAGDTEDPPVRELGDFRLLREIGRGGMGVVYEAQQQSLGRRVALKILPDSVFAAGRQQMRFELESRAAARLHHPHIVPVYGVGEHDGVKYYVMQLVEGCGLDEIIREISQRRRGDTGRSSQATSGRGESDRSARIAAAASWLLSGSSSDPSRSGGVPPTPEIAGSGTLRESSSGPAHGPTGGAGLPTGYPRNIVRLGIRVADAVHYAHRQGVLHRDIKPSNLMLDTSGQIWVMDFGLAKAGDSENLTRTGDLIGTLRYMPPERFRGESTAQSDVYSLGLTLYEMLLLRPAFDAADRDQLVHQLATADLPRPRRLDASFPRDLETILMRACHADPAARYPTAAELRDDLQRFADGRTISARRASVVDQCIKWTRRQPVVAGLTMAVVTSLLLGLTGILWQWSNAEAARKNAEDNLSEIRRTQRDLYQQLYLADLRLAQAALEKERAGEAADILSRHLPQADRDDLREFTWYHLWQASHEGTSVANWSGVIEIKRHADDELLYVVDREHGLQVVDTATLSPRYRFDRPFVEIRLSPDGRFAAAQLGRTPQSEHETLWLIDVRQNQIIEEIAVDLSSVWSFSFSADGCCLLVCGRLRDPKNGRGQYIRWDLETSQADRRFELRDTARDLACCPRDGSFVVWRPGALEWRDPESLEVRRTTPIDVQNPMLEFSRDGRTLVLTGRLSNTIQVIDAESGRLVHTLTGHALPVSDVEFIDRDSALLSGSDDGGIRLWDLQTGTHEHTFSGHHRAAPRLVQISEHEFLSSSWDGIIRRWSLHERSQQTVSLAEAGSAVTALQWNSDGTQLLVGQHHELRRFTAGTWDAAPPVELPGARFSCIVSGIARDTNGTLFLGTSNVESDAANLGAVFRQDTGAAMVTRMATVPNIVRDLRLSNDGRLLACWPTSTVTGPQTYTLTVLDTATAEPAFQLPTEEYVSACVFSSDSQRCWISLSHEVQLRDTRTWEILDSLSVPDEHDAEFTGLVPVPDTHAVVVSDSRGRLDLWDPQRPFPAVSFRGHNGFVSEMLIGPGARQLFSQGYDRTVRIWDLATGLAVATLPAASDESSSSYDAMALSPDGRRLAATVGPTQVRIWNAAGEAEVVRSPVP